MKLYIILFVTFLTGCSMIEHVEPWQKGYLSRPEMTFDVDKLDSAFAEHIYFSKESSAGGAEVGGGGCGCN